jgi:hypothetical protein
MEKLTMPFDGTQNVSRRRVQEIIQCARDNMAQPGRWARLSWSDGPAYCCATHIAVAAGAAQRDIMAYGMLQVLPEAGVEAIERLGGLTNIVARNDNPRTTLYEMLNWLDTHIDSLSTDIYALELQEQLQ